jgi:rhodanese-related sulfurtransferase
MPTPEITCEQFWDIEKSGERPTVIDVREKDEYEAGHIEWATHVPLSSLSKEAEQLFPNKQEPLIVCCAIGKSSLRAVEELQNLGYVNAKSLSGGYSGYCGGLDNPEIPSEEPEQTDA